MRNLKTWAILLLFLTTSGLIQAQKPSDRITTLEQMDANFMELNLFQEANSDLNSNPAVTQVLSEGMLVELDLRQLKDAFLKAPAQLRIPIPTPQKTYYLKLTRHQLLSQNFLLRSSDGEITEPIQTGIHYMGRIEGEPNSLAALSIFEEEVMGLFSGDESGNYVIGRLDVENNLNDYVIYNDQKMKIPYDFECHTSTEDVQFTASELMPHSTKNSVGCVEFYFEVDQDIYQDKGSSMQNTTNYVTGMFNQVATMYANENITVAISEIYVWTSNSPYAGLSSSTDMLYEFRDQTPTFNGDLGHLISYRSSGGVAWLNQLCSSTQTYQRGFSDIYSSYSTVPTYSWTVDVVTHEIGHNLGSPHTHDCSWNGNNTAIDGCYTTSGSCSQPPIPSNGGTIMSYCHLQSVGKDFNQGFGPQPGDLIRNRVSNASCLGSCGGGTPTCSNTISSFPYTEGFESGLAWTQGNGDDINWTQRSGSTPSSSTGPSGANQGSYYAYIEASSPNYPSKTAHLISPCFDLSGQSNANFQFSYHMYGSSMGTLRLEVSTDQGATWTQIWSRTGNQGNQWLSATVSLNNYLSQNVQLRFNGTTGSSYTSDICVDGLSISTSGGGSCTNINFNNYTINSYGGTQDQGTASVQNSGNDLFIANNAWKSISLNYTVTANTVIEFDFRSTIEGEIHGIGFDSDNSISSNRTAKVYGTQNWGITNYDNYSGTSWTSYAIPIGNFYTGSFDRLFFVADDDAGSSGNAYFRNVRICESAASPALSNKTAAMQLGDEAEAESPVLIQPNPAKNFIEVLIPGDTNQEVIVYSTAGVVLRNLQLKAGWNRLNIEDLAPGMYCLRVNGTTHKFVKY